MTGSSLTMDSSLCERRQILNPKHPCRARSLPGTTACLAHTQNLEQVIAQLGEDANDLLLVQNLDINNALLTILLAHQATLGTDFRGATFTDSANFLGVTFTGTASFDGTTFTGIADFATATFNSGASFREATFTGTANFGGTVFTGEARFRRANFTGTADFARATFTGETDFGEATFTSTNFFGASFTDTADFRRATFTDTAVYMGAAFTNVASFDEATFTGANFSWAAFARTAGFRAATFTSAANFASATFTDVASFFGATFPATANFRRATFTLAADLRVNPSLCTIDLSSASFGSGVAIVTSGALVLNGLLIRDPLTVTADGPQAAIVSLQKSTLEAPVIIGDGVSLAECALSYATGLDKLRVLGTNPWGSTGGGKQSSMSPAVSITCAASGPICDGNRLRGKRRSSQPPLLQGTSRSRAATGNFALHWSLRRTTRVQPTFTTAKWRCVGSAHAAGRSNDFCCSGTRSWLVTGSAPIVRSQHI